MEATNLDSFLTWSEEAEGNFPELQFSFENDDTFQWDQILDEYLDPFPLDAFASIKEQAEAIESLPELTPSSFVESSEVQVLTESVTELKDRVNCLEDRITESQRKIANLEAYIERLEPFLMQMSNSVQEIRSGGDR